MNDIIVSPLQEHCLNSSFVSPSGTSRRLPLLLLPSLELIQDFYFSGRLDSGICLGVKILIKLSLRSCQVTQLFLSKIRGMLPGNDETKLMQVFRQTQAPYLCNEIF